MEGHGYPPGPEGIPRDPMGILGDLWQSTEIHADPRRYAWIHRYPPGSAEIRGDPRRSAGIHGYPQQ
eukprot:5819135-Lingulodinium_polyedra.AAC.1